jgi:hypothetical protein
MTQDDDNDNNYDDDNDDDDDDDDVSHKNKAHPKSSQTIFNHHLILIPES